MEEVLRTHRDHALKILLENRAQSREGIELLVRGHLGAITAAASKGTPSLTPEDLEAVYQEVLDLSFIMFSLGYTMAHTLPKDSLSRR